ncbi:MAG: TldD/PmbA family protein [Alphaproteobacteria bacterium]
MSLTDTALQQSDQYQLGQILDLAKAAGADAADALLVRSQAQDVTMRMGEIEHLERAEAVDLGLRVLIGQKQAMLSTSDLSKDSLGKMAETAVAMARLVPDDPYCGLAQPAQLATDWDQPDVYDDTEISTEQMIERARAVEATALEPDGITNSQGGTAAASQSMISLAGTHGFSGSYRRSRHGLSVTVLAGEGTGMERDYAWTSGTHFADLKDPESVGQEAADKTLKRLNPGRPKTGQWPVVLDRQIASGLLGSLAGGINGNAIARGTSFLKDKMGQQILPSGMSVIDDPTRAHGLRSSAFDAEGLPRQQRAMVENGVLQSWFLDLRSARQLGLNSTGHASRGTSSAPSPSATNLYLTPGSASFDELIADIEYGVLVTGTMGHGPNLITGDYSQGANGFLIEKGEITSPVSEMTIAGHLAEILLNMTAANDLIFERGIDSPSLRIEGLTVAGA